MCYVIYNILLKINRIEIIIHICTVLTIIIIISILLIYELKYYTNEIIYIIDKNGIIREIKNISKKKIK